MVDDLINYKFSTKRFFNLSPIKESKEFFETPGRANVKYAALLWKVRARVLTINPMI